MLEKDIKSNPEKFIARLKPVNQVYKAGLKQTAIEEFHKIKQYTNTSQEHFSLGKLARKIGLYNEAEIQFESAHRSNPGDLTALESLTSLYLFRGEVGQAVKVLKQLISEDPANQYAREKLTMVANILRPCGFEYEEIVDGDSFDTTLRYPDIVFRLLVDKILQNKPRIYEPVSRRLVVITFYLRLGGIERKVINLVHGLHNLKDKIESVTLLCKSLSHRKVDATLLPLCEKYGLNVKEYSPADNKTDPYGHEYLKTYTDYLMPLNKLGMQITQLVNELVISRPEAVHCFGYQSAEFGIAAALAGVPQIILHSGNMRPETMLEDDNWQDHSLFIKHLYQSLARLPNVKIVNNCYKASQDFTQWLNLPENRIYTVHNGIEFNSMESIDRQESVNRRKSLGIPDGSKIIGSAFRFAEQKNPSLWIETAKQVAMSRSDTCFILLGEGPLYNQMQQQIKNAGLTDYFFMPGVVLDMHIWYGLFDAILLTSVMEGTSNVAIEAQWYGVPVITTNVGGMSETIQDGKSGWLVDPAEPEKLAEKILWVLEHPEWCKGAAKSGREFVQQKFNMENMINKVLELSWN